MDISQQVGATAAASLLKRQRNLGDITDYLDSHWKVQVDPSLQRMRMLDAALQYPSRQLSAILVAGTNGKSITAHFAAKLLANEGLNVGVYTSPHVLMYKERFSIGLKSMPSKIFTELGNEVIAAAEEAHITAHTSELLAAMAFVYFKRNNVDVAILEVASREGVSDPVSIVDAKIATITRVTPYLASLKEEDVAGVAESIAGLVKPGMHVISGDQSKATLQLLQRVTVERGGQWAMPIRKLAHLSYPFEQLYGRCAALAERIAHLFVENHADRSLIDEETSLLLRVAGQRGRPTLEKKREQELHPKKTIEQFWRETVCDLPCKFQLLDKEKPSILLDTASNVDAFDNVLLGVRLLHYQRPLKGLAIIVGAEENSLYNEEFLKTIRYFFKKTAGQILICPLGEPAAGSGNVSWDTEQVANDIKSMKVKARACASFEEAFDVAKKSVDERNGLVVITGSHAIVSAYWHHKGVKKF